jgi:trehalose/maltose hydrolase-like predicted phosphorylase
MILLKKKDSIISLLVLEVDLQSEVFILQPKKKNHSIYLITRLTSSTLAPCIHSSVKWKVEKKLGPSVGQNLYAFIIFLTEYIVLVICTV